MRVRIDPASKLKWTRCLGLGVLLLGACADGKKPSDSDGAVESRAADGGKPDGGQDDGATDASVDGDAGGSEDDSGSGVEAGAEVGAEGGVIAVVCDCLPERPCLPDGSCDCSEPDLDDDNQKSHLCGGDDCDDTNSSIFKGGVEICDSPESEQVDEDCDPETFGDRDQDGDGWVDANCFNIDPETGAKYGGQDCKDLLRNVNPDVSEVCDYFDNDCDGLIDQGEDGEEYSMRAAYVPDNDDDRFGDTEAKVVLACIQPALHVLAGGLHDEDDHDPDVYPGADEICDNKDNDGENGTDQEDPNFVTYIEFTNTTLECNEGRLEITRCPPDTLWCPELYTCPGGQEWCDAKLVQGCAVDATRLSSCHACETACSFACGEEGCDEVVQLSLGARHSCAVTSEGNAACWGRGRDGRLGNDSTNSQLVPGRVLGLGDVRRIATGDRHTCAIVGEDRELFCWGDNEHNQLGSVFAEGGESIAVPVPVDDGELFFFDGTADTLVGVVDVDLGETHTCAVVDTDFAAGLVFCWGQQSDGRLGEGEAGSGQRPAYLIDDFDFWIENAVEVAVGDRHGCLRTSGGDVSCWGDNSQGQLGRDPTETSGSPYVLPVPGLSDVTALAAGGEHTCALSAGEVVCWGSGGVMQLGREPGTGAEPDYVPQPVPGLPPATSIASGTLHSCALASGSLWCWGSNDAMQLATEAEADGLPPRELELGDETNEVVGVAAGASHTCALLDSGEVRCWGGNFFGQLGVGDVFEFTGQPTLLSPLSGSLP